MSSEDKALDITIENVGILREQVEQMKVVLLEIASVNPAQRGIEWAKSVASRVLGGDNSMYLAWRAAIDECSSLRARLTALEEQEPVGHMYTMQSCFPGEPKRAHAQMHKALPEGTKLYAQPVAQAQQGFRAGISAAAALIRKRIEAYDEECGSTDPETGTREYPGNGSDWVYDMDELADDIEGIAAPQPVAKEGGRNE